MGNEKVRLIVGATRCYGDGEWFREITVEGITFLVPLDQEDAARHILARVKSSQLSRRAADLSRCQGATNV